MSSKKQQIIKELALEVETTRRDYEAVVNQRDAAETKLLARENVARINNAAKREAAIQEKVDGIKAGLIPTDELRRAFDGLEIDAEGTAFVTYRFDKHADRVQKALSDVLTAKPKPKYAEGGYVNRDLLGKINSSDFVDEVIFTYPPFKVGDAVDTYRLRDREFLVSRNAS